MTIKAVLFDAYGTLFDVYSVSQLAEALFPSHGERLAALWRDKQIEYTRLVSMSGRAAGEAMAPANARGPADDAAFNAASDAASDATGDLPGSPHYRPFWDLTRAGLRFAAARLQLDLSADAEERLMDAYRHLRAFPENRQVLEGLRRLGLPAGILSNGDPAMLAAAVGSAGLAELLDPVISVHATRRYKTDPAAYALGPAALGLPAREILFVSSNGWDAIGATWYGYTTMWVNRAGLPLERLDTEPHHTGRSLLDVLELLERPDPLRSHPPFTERPLPTP